MTTHRLLIIMARYANSLVKNYITDFTKHDTEAIKNKDAQVRFIWQVYEKGTHLYHFDQQDWEQILIERIDYCKQSGESNIYFYYNRKKLRLIFESEARKIAEERIKTRQKKTIKQQQPCTTKL